MPKQNPQQRKRQESESKKDSSNERKPDAKPKGFKPAQGKPRQGGNRRQRRGNYGRRPRGIRPDDTAEQRIDGSGSMETIFPFSEYATELGPRVSSWTDNSYQLVRMQGFSPMTPNGLSDRQSMMGAFFSQVAKDPNQKDWVEAQKTDAIAIALEGWDLAQSIVAQANFRLQCPEVAAKYGDDAKGVWTTTGWTQYLNETKIQKIPVLKCLLPVLRFMNPIVMLQPRSDKRAFVESSYMPWAADNPLSASRTLLATVSSRAQGRIHLNKIGLEMMFLSAEEVISQCAGFRMIATMADPLWVFMYMESDINVRNDADTSYVRIPTQYDVVAGQLSGKYCYAPKGAAPHWMYGLIHLINPYQATHNKLGCNVLLTNLPGTMPAVTDKIYMANYPLEGFGGTIALHGTHEAHLLQDLYDGIHAKMGIGTLEGVTVDGPIMYYNPAIARMNRQSYSAQWSTSEQNTLALLNKTTSRMFRPKREGKRKKEVAIDEDEQSDS